MERTKTIIRTSVIGIAANVVLVLFKMAVGLIANSVAVILDAVNNLSDALSSVITIVGTKLSAKAPDKKHPYGHGRVEYLTSMIVALIVLIAGLTAMKESVEKIITPEAANYSVVSVVIVSAAIVAKLALGVYVRSVGKRIHAQSLVASGTDAFFDAILSAGTLVAMLVSIFAKISIEGYVGVIISVIILKAGVEILKDTLDSLIGVRADPELTQSLIDQINSYEGVNGTYDLTLHNYGPSRILGSAHIEVDDTMTARQIHDLTRRIVMAVAMKQGVLLSIGIYASNNSDPRYAKMKEDAQKIIAEHPEILQMHGFYVNDEARMVMFDIIVDFGKDAASVKESVLREYQALYPDYFIDVVLDTDFST